jgi:hypothetical protein
MKYQYPQRITPESGCDFERRYQVTRCACCLFRPTVCQIGPSRGGQKPAQRHATIVARVRGRTNPPPLVEGCVKNSRFLTNNPQQTKDLRGFRARVRARAGQDDVRFTNLGRSLFTPSRFTQEFA